MTQQDPMTVWGSLRGVIKDGFTFNQIKDIVGAIGLPVYKLAHLQQRSLPAKGSSKSDLLDAIDSLLIENREPDKAISRFIAAMLRHNPRLEVVLNEHLANFGWSIQNGLAISNTPHIDVKTVNLCDEIQSALENCIVRFNNQDYSGAVTCVCGAVDHLTETIYGCKNLGKPYDDSYQTRVAKAFSSFESDFTNDLSRIGSLDAEEVKRIWGNYKGAVNQAAYVLGSFRRNISDAHGTNDCPIEFVQKTLDCGTFILRSISPYIQNL